MDKPKRESKPTTTVPHVTDDASEIEIKGFCLRLRTVREGKGLTLLDVEMNSNGQVTAVALGSYERGDRKMSLSKLFEIARIYNMPASEFLVDAGAHIEPGRITVDLRKITQVPLSQSAMIVRVFKSIAQQRGDWNGEVLSVRASDLSNLHIFSGLSTHEINTFIAECTVSRSK